MSDLQKRNTITGGRTSLTSRKLAGCSRSQETYNSTPIRPSRCTTSSRSARSVAVDLAPKVINWVERIDDFSWLPVDGDHGWISADALDSARRSPARSRGRSTGKRRSAYQGKCLQWIREDDAALSGEDRQRVDAVLSGTGCEQLLATPAD